MLSKYSLWFFYLLYNQSKLIQSSFICSIKNEMWGELVRICIAHDLRDFSTSIIINAVNVFFFCFEMWPRFRHTSIHCPIVAVAFIERSAVNCFTIGITGSLSWTMISWHSYMELWLCSFSISIITFCKQMLLTACYMHSLLIQTLVRRVSKIIIVNFYWWIYG